MMRQIGYRRPQARSGFSGRLFLITSLLKSPPATACQAKDPKKKSDDRQPEEIIDVSEFMRDPDRDYALLSDASDFNNKENINPPNPNPCVSQKQNSATTQESRGASMSEINISTFRRPELNSSSLFDPNLVAAFRQAVADHIRIHETIHKIRRDKKEEDDPLLGFQEKCPPGGRDSVILYTTSLHGIMKTFEECNSVRFLLESFRVAFCERDVSMDRRFREELWEVAGGRTVPPRLFIRGRHIGGAETVVALNEEGKLRRLFEGIPVSRRPCEWCDGIRFVVCFRCNGGRKAHSGGKREDCSECNENGLRVCPLCSDP